MDVLCVFAEDVNITHEENTMLGVACLARKAQMAHDPKTALLEGKNGWALMIQCIALRGGRMFMPLSKAPGLAFLPWLSLCWRKRARYH